MFLSSHTSLTLRRLHSSALYALIASVMYVETVLPMSAFAATNSDQQAPLTEIGHLVVTANPPARHSGTDISISSAQLAHSPTGNSLSGILTQLPSAARATNGQVHINGDHNGLNYVIDGVQLPASLNQVIGNQIEPADIGSIEVLQGAYPAQYGDRFASVLEVNTKAQSGPAGSNASVQVGSYGTLDTTAGYHTPLAKGGSVTVGLRNAQSNRGLDPAVTHFVHDRSNDASQFVHVELPAHNHDSITADLLHSTQSFQIPPDTASGVPATTDDDEYQDDTFTSLTYHHDINGHGSLTFGPSIRISSILDTNDLQNDLAAGGGAPAPNATSSCNDFSANASGTLPACDFSVYANRSSHDYRFNTDYDLRSKKHDIRAGALYDATVVDKDYDITLQPYSALGQSVNGTNAPYTVTDTSPNIAHQQEAYLQDSWKMGTTYQLDYGMRADAFQIFSNDFNHGFSQWSPRVKLTRIFTPHSNVYAYYGRLFEPFSFESVSPSAAAALYTQGENPQQTFDLKPERDSLYEIGGQLPIGKGELGARIEHRVATDWIDDTQVGATNLHQDINYPQGRVDIETGYYSHPLAHNGKYYASLTHSIALNSTNCETQLLQNCAISAAGGPLVQADHDQRWDMNSGFIMNDRHQGWVSFSSEYGSGLSLGNATACSTDDTINCKVSPHLIFNAEKGIATGPNTTVALIMNNFLNDHYALTLDSSLQGTHYAEPRTIYVRFNFQK